MSVRIFGAGMAGLLTATMLRRLSPTVYDAQPSLPDNHGALLRFRSAAVERETGQPFRRVRVLKAVKGRGGLRSVSTIRDANLYSLKVTGAVSPRSVLDLEPADRFIAPDTFLSGLARDARLAFGRELTGLDLHELKGQSENVLISTIPMPALMRIAGWPNVPAFEYRAVWSVVVTITEPSVDVYQTIYYPEPDTPYYRASITGNRLIVEFFADPCADGNFDAVDGALSSVLRDFGLPPNIKAGFNNPKRQEYGKLLPIPERERREFILAMSDEFNVYSVGRFATWRQILLDDVVNDVRVVESMITQRSAYARRLLSTRARA